MTNEKEICSIYLLSCTKSPRIYIGQTWEPILEDRMGRDGNGYSNSPYLFSAIQKHGAENFYYTLLETCDTQEEADAIEDKYILQYNVLDHDIGYNLKRGGSHGKHSEETKQKISDNASKPWLGKHLPEEHKQKISETKLAMEYHHTEEWKEANSEMMIKRHEEQGHPMQGKHHTEEAKQKISEAGKGRVLSPETIQKRITTVDAKRDHEKEQEIIQQYQLGETARTICEKYDMHTSKLYRILHRHNIPLSNNFSKWEGKTHSEETKSKMSQSAKECWDKRKDAKSD